MKNTRKLLAAVMALSMVSAIAPMSVFADTPVRPDPDNMPNPKPASAEFEVKYDVDPSYTVTIPAGVDITTGDKTASITLDEGALLAEGTKINVVLEKGAYTTTGNAFTAKTASGNSSASYQINGGNVKVGDVVASLDKDTRSADLTFSRTATITPTFAGTHSEVLTFKVSVESASTPVTAITLNKTETTIVKGSDETLSVTAVTPDNATDKTVTWSSDEESVATVDADGKVTAVAAGTANITATANDGSGVTATCVVTVAPLYYDKAVQVYQYDNPGYRDYVYSGNYKTLSADEGYALAQYFASVNSCSVCVITDWIDSSGQMKYVTNSSSAEQQSIPSFFGRYDRVYLVPKN